MIDLQELSSKKKLGLIIKLNRKKRGISQNELAKTLIYDQSVVSRIEKGYENINYDLYLHTLSFFDIYHKENKMIEKQIFSLIDQMFSSYEILNIEHFNDYMIQIDKLLAINHNIIYSYNLLCLKMVCYYMFTTEKTKDLLIELKPIYHLCEKKCQLLYQIIEFQYILHEKDRLELDKREISFQMDSENGLIQYLWGKYFFQAFNYSKAIEYLSRAINQFQYENNITRMIRAELMINEILLTSLQYELVKSRTIKFLQLKECIHPYDKHKLIFQLGYCQYHLTHYEEASMLLQEVVEKKIYNLEIVTHVYHKCLFKLTKHQILTELKPSHIFDYLFFMMKEKDKDYFTLIEKYIQPKFESRFYLKETQHYIFELLDYYFDHSKYKLYRQLSDKINKILHIYE